LPIAIASQPKEDAEEWIQNLIMHSSQINSIQSAAPDEQVLEFKAVNKGTLLVQNHDSASEEEHFEFTDDLHTSTQQSLDKKK